MIHHVSLGTNDIVAARAFYDPIMALLGFRMLKHDAGAAHYGIGEIQFSIARPDDGAAAGSSNGVHIAFQAVDRPMVQAFHKLALAHGGSNAGAPAVRERYDPHYYAAFVTDPDGNKIEALTFSSN
ncbi:catechol 2,3-dioxygenase-like lactoylglutathione lyase family enzyme [Sphingomonas zeicaulis]|uniref:VOC family protein n=1 Tax=Sphingomonas zeicaulis TaxID=1632740 RepID=UPI003D1E5012